MKNINSSSSKTNTVKCEKYKSLKFKPTKKSKFVLGLLCFGIINLIWFLFRTGLKPSRVTYPCQQTALRYIIYSITTLIPLLSFTAFFHDKRKWTYYLKIGVVVLLIFTPLGGGFLLQKALSVQEISIPINSITANDAPISNIFIVNGREVCHVSNLIDVMGNHNLLFYQSNTIGTNQGPTGLIAASDVVLIKINCQWAQRGGTNTDLIKEVIQGIIEHPDGFSGEIIVADNGQGSGSMDWNKPNAEDQQQSTQDVVDFFSEDFNVSTFLWDTIRGIEVQEFSLGDMDNGYIVYDDFDPETGIFVSYPKFTTVFGTKVSCKNGIWNGTAFEPKLKVINLPILKTHGSYGVTACMKHYVGFQSQALGNGHQKVATGGMATLMVECGLPTLNILDAIWINANPYPSLSVGPSTDYNEATRVNILMASLDPVALDYWAAKHVLQVAAEMQGHLNIGSINPDNSKKGGLTEAFGVWLNETRDEFLRGGFNVTTNEENMNIYANSIEVTIGEPSHAHYWKWIGIGATALLILSITIFLVVRTIRLRKRKNIK